MIEGALAAGSRREMLVYHGARTADDLYDQRRWDDLDARRPILPYRPVVADGSWAGRRGLVTDAIERDVEHLRGFEAYLCGPPPMITAAVSTLLAKRVRGGHIHREERF